MRSFFAWLLGMCAGFGMCAALYALVDSSTPRFGDRAAPVVRLTDGELASVISQLTTPTEIELVIASPERFASDYDGHSSVSSLVAYAYPNRTPCRIVVHAGQSIVASPEHSWAAWADPRDGDTLAHEILHCLRGSWHRR